MSDKQNAQAAVIPPKTFMHLTEATKWLGLSKRQGLYEAKTGRLKVFWITCHPHVMVEDLQAYVQDRVNEAAAVRQRREEQRLARAQRRAEQNQDMATCAA